ncbi:hypothetical protein VTN96DRAFT_181 [Rasamsonia emersonii]|uniref:Uncharacterized protein n=1 Tax=Rasamsonia emersonii (strain ATCC 16479 / CBS 393.64 / IMI 116815) TaxID=1408163 RepID=A0A0F4YS37_RASE3|nr:hypothetical protein T310_4923 [Rasamsonia emersonii CBS 393.64]KKA21064.1 hypothetical protein T310_4923 [Rasamsonia emersonii CBS 393.64]
MKFCLRPRRPTQLGSRLYVSHHGFARCRCGLRLTEILNWGTCCRANTGSWNRAFSSGSTPRLATYSDLSRSGHVSPQTRESPARQRCPIPAAQRKDLGVWIQHLEPFLPRHLRESASASPDEPEPPQATSSQDTANHEGLAIATLLSQARRLENLDLLAHLGFGLRRWPAVDALTTKLLDATDTSKGPWPMNLGLPSNIEWGPGPMDLTTNDSLRDRPTAFPVKSSTERRPDTAPVTLDTLADEPPAHASTRMIMGEVWQSLGFIILEAADLPADDAAPAMSFVYRTLARLHHSAAISDVVYKYSRPLDDEASFRPPGMYLLSTHIMNVLSDAMWLEHEAEVSAKAAAAGEKSPYRPFKMGIRHLGPEIWLEFVLWCCVEEGHVKEGVWILEQMKARKGDLAWKVASWKPLLNRPDLIRDTDIDTEDFWPHPEAERTHGKSKSATGFFHGLGKRTISVEVVASLLDGAVNLVDRGVGFQGYPFQLVLQYLVFLNNLIAQSTGGDKQASGRHSYWPLVRMIESQGIDPQADPRAFERLLKARPPVLPPWDDSTPITYEELDAFTKLQLYDSSSALTGLLEYNLRAYAANRQTGGAFNVFAWLQELIDKSKIQHMQRFLEEIKHLDDAKLAPDQAPPSLNRSSIPQLSNVTFAELLDLATVSRAFSFGEWLLFSTDVDGPFIPLAAYGDQALAPSIMRFAAATRNTELCDKVVESLSRPIVRNTLKALLNFRITMGEWDRVETMLGYLRDHKHKSWGESNVTALAAAVLRLDRSARNSTGSNHEAKRRSLTRAKEILVRVLNGEFNVQPNPAKKSLYQERALHRLHQVFSSIPGPLEEVCRAAKLQYQPASSRDLLPYIPSVAFHNLLDAVVDLYGSAAGKRLWERWCLDHVSPETGRLTDSGVFRLYTSKDRNLDQGDPHFDVTWFRQMHKKAVIPNLNTVRIIARAAVKEYRQCQSGKATPPPRDSLPTALPAREDGSNDGDVETAEEVLDFCVERYRRLRLDEKEIDREVQGHLSRMLKRQQQQQSAHRTRDNSNSSS